MSVYLHIRTPDKKITVDYEISVLNQSNALIFAREQARLRHSRTVERARDPCANRRTALHSRTVARAHLRARTGAPPAQSNSQIVALAHLRARTGAPRRTVKQSKALIFAQHAIPSLVYMNPSLLYINTSLMYSDE